MRAGLAEFNSGHPTALHGEVRCVKTSTNNTLPTGTAGTRGKLKIIHSQTKNKNKKAKYIACNHALALATLSCLHS